MTDNFSPITAGDTGAPFAPTFQQTLIDGSIAPVNLTGATISMKMVGESANNSGVTQICTGTWTIASDPTTGKASYAYSSADVATPGTWGLSIVISIAGKPEHADMKTLIILPAP